MVAIPYALTYTTTVKGRIPKLVQCDKCAFQYVYLLEMTAAGDGTSFLFLDNQGARDRSAETAHASLQQGLQHGCEIVPCPECGHVQLHMLPLAQDRHLWWLRYAGIIALAVAGILTLPAVIYALIDSTTDGISGLTAGIWTGICALVCAGVAAMIWRISAAAKYDPNDASEEVRKRQGQALAVSLPEYLKIIAATEPAPKTGPIDERIIEK